MLLILCGQKSISEKWVEKYINPYINITGISHTLDNVLKIRCSKNTILNNQLKEIFYQNGINFSLQVLGQLPKKLLISDMDSTVIKGESIDEMAKAYGLSDNFTLITKRAMQGEIDFHQALIDRLKLLKGMDIDTINRLVDEVEFNFGARDLMIEIRRLGIYSCLVSGGFGLFASHVGGALGFDKYFANKLEFDQKRLTGNCIGELIDGEKKKNILLDFVRQNNIDTSQTIAIGDGANDLPMLKTAGLGVAYKAKPEVRKQVNTEIHTGSLIQLIHFI